MTSLLAGFALGIAGSGHCLGMCGPLVLTVGRDLTRPSRRGQVQHALLYHLGRVLAYVAVGIVVGFIGQVLALAGFGRALAVAGGVLLLATAMGAVGTRLPGRLGSICAMAATRACTAANRWRGTHPIAGPVVTGAANGLLPCGLVYAAATAAAAMGTAAHAVALMIGFALGTLPALVALSISTASLPVGLQVRLRRLTPVVLALTAALLIVRGLTSPSISPDHHHVPSVVVPR
jgi:uncharacterized protein